MDALTDYEGVTLQYRDIARKIEKLHILLSEGGIRSGDKVALCGQNSSQWGVAFLAVLAYGAVAVPILHEYDADTVHKIVNHSDARLLFVDDIVWESLDESEMSLLEGVLLLADFTLLTCRSKELKFAREHLNEMFGKKFPRNFRKEHVSYRRDDAEELAVISYTSGTTDSFKGVMLPYRSLCSNTEFAFEALHLQAGNRVISVIPMAHIYGLTFGLVYEICAGCHVYFLTRVPSAEIVFHALSDVKPHIVVSVPFVIEEIVRKCVLPKLEMPKMKFLLRLPIINEKIESTLRDYMVQAFGGSFYEVIMGGAALNQDMERMFRSIDFPYTVGYGMTECGPVICYEDWHRYKPGSCGKVVPYMEIKIDSPAPERIVGEILTRGDNVMLGYYKNPEATSKAIDKDGWLHTGDLGVMDADGNLTIRGRCDNILYGSSGQNIYPEDIEKKIDTLPYVRENIVIRQNNNRLAALIHPDLKEAYANGLTDEDVEKIMEKNISVLNSELPSYSQIMRIRIYTEEFEKTPKKIIKRFLYQDVK